MTFTSTPLRALLPSTRAPGAKYADLLESAVRQKCRSAASSEGGITAFHKELSRLGPGRFVEKVARDAGIPDPAREAAAFFAAHDAGNAFSFLVGKEDRDV